MALDRPEAPNQPVSASRTGRRAPLDRVEGTLALRLLLVIMAFCALSHTQRASGGTVGIDYYQFWAVGRSVARHGSSDIYSTAGRTRLGRESYAAALRSKSNVQRVVAEYRLSFDTTSTPFLYSVFGVLSTGDYEANLRWHRLFLLGCFVGSVAGLAYLLELSATFALLLVALFSLWFEPLASDLRVGNVSCLQLAGIVVAAILRSRLPVRYRYWLTGVWLGLLVAFKPNLALVVVALSIGLAYRRAWKAFGQEAIAMLLGASAAVGLSSWAFGSTSVWWAWLRVLREMSKGHIAVALGNMAATEVLRDVLGAPAWAALTVLALAAALFTYFARSLSRSEPGTLGGDSDCDNALWFIAVGALGVLLVPQLAWLHYFVIAVPAMLLVLCQLPTRLPAWPAGLAHYLGMLSWLVLAFNPFIMLGRSYTVRSFAVMTVIGTYALLCSALMQFSPWRGPPEPR